MKSKRNDSAISEILSTVLLLGIAIGLFSVVYSITIPTQTVQSSPSVTIFGYIQNENIILEHYGGESISTDSYILLEICGNNTRVNISTPFLSDINNNNEWDLGEKILYDTEIQGLQVEATVVNQPSNSILFTGILQKGLTQESPFINLNTSVNTISPYLVTFSSLNLTATGYSSLDNVTLWYRYSPDNSSWENSTNWWNGNWNYYRTISIDHNKIDEKLVNFPILIKINSTIGAKCDNGDSIRFIGTDNSTEYYYEIEEWNSVGDSYVWVNITSISSTSDTKFLMYYNNSAASDNQNPSNVWDANYIGVWHLSESSGTHHDSTSNNHDSSTVVGATQDATGMIDGGDDFDGSNDYIDINMNLPSTVTISAWAKSTANTLVDMLWCIDSNNRGPDLFFYNNRISLNTWNGAGNPFCSIPSNVDEWHLYSTVIQSGNTNLYIDGQICGSASYRNPTGSDFHISSSAGYDWQGSIDEVQISNIVRNSSWINACYQNQNDIASFLTIDNEQNKNVGINWTNYCIDVSSPWQWNFNLPNNTGYYEFYSIGKHNDNVEEVPENADAICYYNPSALLTTSVDTISPYEQIFSPANITATGDHRLDNITLWYRYSPDNSTWWNSSWSKRKTINMNASSESTPSKYQVLLNITFDNDMNNNFSDLRFVNYSDNSTELDYWIGSKRDGYWAQVWVEIGNSITKANQTVAWMYYGNSGASSTSNGNNTFLFFDNFPGTNIDTNKWQVNANSYSVSNSILRINIGAVSVKNALSFNLNDGYILEGKIRYPGLASSYSGTLSAQSSHYTQSSNRGADATNLFMRTNNHRTICRWTGRGNSGSYNCGYNGVFTSSDNVWYILGAKFHSGGVKLTKDRSSEWSYGCGWTKNINYISLGAFHGSSSYNIQDTEYDWILVRKYATIEPSLNNFGEEQNGGIDWTIFDVDNSNVNGWNWSFNFPNGTGYYHFYSICSYNSDTEEVPKNADTTCYYNASEEKGELSIWHFDETSGSIAYDSIGNYNGTVNGASWVSGISGSALSFDGINDYVDISDSNNFNLGDTISFEVWVYPTDQKTSKIVQKGDWDGHGLGQDNWNGWKGEIYIDGDKKYSVAWEEGRPDLNTWYHLVLTYDGSYLRLYVNGTEVDNETVSGNLRVNSRNIFIGSDGGVQKFFNGIIDEVTIYNKAISANEILNKYNTLKP